VKNDKKDFEDWKEELAEGIVDGIGKFTDCITYPFESLTYKMMDRFSKELGRISKETSLIMKNTDTADTIYVLPVVAPRKGDVIFTQRLLYKHFGICSGRNRIIHYARKENPVRLKITIEETSLGEFSRGDPMHVVYFPKKAGHLYSPRETVRRAKSLIGRTDYNLVSNNCEHFAWWCKTGEHESSQVKDVCERLFNKRFELDELRDEITDKVWDVVDGIFDGIGNSLNNLLESLPGGGLKLH
jgi:hypothetical protein